MTEDSRVKREKEIELISTKVLKIQKVLKKKIHGSYVCESNRKTVDEEFFFSKWTYIPLVNDHDEVAIPISSVN